MSNVGDSLYAELTAGKRPTRLIVMRSIQSWDAEVWDLTATAGVRRVWGPMESVDLAGAKQMAEAAGRKYSNDYDTPIQWSNSKEIHIRVS
jgi:hypothetical protein